jgi:hypothetical protein
VRRAGGGCAATHQTENAKPGTTSLFAGGAPIPAGAGSVSATPTLTAGHWVVCAWLDQPNGDAVVTKRGLAFTVAPKPKPGKASPGLAFTSATASTTSGIAIAGTTTPTFRGPLTIRLVCGLITLRAKATASGGAFSATSPLPAGCVAGDVVQIGVSSAGQAHFVAQDIATTATVTGPPPVTHHARPLPRLFSVVHRQGGRVTNVFRLRPHHVQVALSAGGPLTLRWTRWTRFGARGHGTAHPGTRHFAVHVHATHPTHGHFACLSLTARRHGRRHTTRLALARVRGSRPLAWVPVGRLGPQSRYRAVTKQGCR